MTGAVLLLLVAATAVAQVRENITVNLVEVPVSVVDGNGNPVRGLTAANFELYDQGKKQQIAAFDTIDFAVRDSVNAISPMNPAARRSFLLLFDLGYSSPNSLSRAQQAARQFVKESAQPRDLIGVGTIDVDRGFRLLAAFTTDRELVASAIGDPLNFRGTDPLQIANQLSTFQVEEEALATLPDRGPPPREGRTAALADQPPMSQEARDNERETAQSIRRGSSGAARKRIEKQVDALGELAKILRTIPGRKQVIFLSEGFDATLLQGRNARADVAEQKRTTDQKNDNERTLNGQEWAVDTDARYGSTSSLTILDRMAGYFRSSDVVLHAIDIKGVRVQNDVVEGATINSNDGLFTLSRPTGGTVFQNSNDLKDNFARMLRAQEVLYILGFQAQSVKPGTFHELKVKVVGANAARVSHRAGYFESGPDSVVAEKSMTDAEIIVNDVPQRDIRVDALTAALPGDETHGQVPIVLEINGEDLLRTPNDGNAIAEVYVYAFDRDGVVRDRLYEKMRLDLAKAGDRLRATGAKWIGVLTLPPGEYAVKSLVRIPGSERRGFARTNVHVPGAGEIAATPFFVDQLPRQWVIVRGMTLDPAHSPFQVGSETLMPSAAARLRKGEARRFALFVSGAGVDELKVDATLVPARGSEPPRMVAQAEAPGLAKLVFDCDTAGLALGPATLRIVVHRNGTNDLKATLPLVVSQ
jgi:VWFA-related protein